MRSFDDVVEQVRKSIAGGSIGAGERLPSEREMAEEFGVSRATLREALRALEALGLLEIRLGAHGGAFATEPNNERFVAGLRDLFTTHVGSRRDEFLEFRATFHADNVLWANITEVELESLSASIGSGMSTFLSVLAHTTRDPLRSVMAEAIETTMSRFLAPQASVQGKLRQVLDLLKSGDVYQARSHLYRILAGEDQSRFKS